MFQEAIKTIAEAEEKAKRIRQEAAASAKQAVEDATLAGETKVRDAVQQAETECADMMRKAEEKAAKEAGDLASNTENKKAALRVRAESSMSRAVKLITERIVGA